jgi:hypothetical protein
MDDLKATIAELRRLAAAERTAGPYAAQSVADILHYLIGDVHGIGIFQATSPYPERRSNEVAFAAAAMNAAIPLADRVEALEAENARLKAEMPGRQRTAFQDGAYYETVRKDGVDPDTWTKAGMCYPDAEGEKS